MAIQDDALRKLRDFAERVKDNNDDRNGMDEEQVENYVSRLNRSLHSLQNQVKQHEAALEKVANSNGTVCSAS